MPSKTHVQTTIDGEQVDFLCEPRQSLLEVLRDVIGLTGSKEGCNDGNCGACTVEFDGRIVTSCLVLGVEAEGKEITTIEGIASGSTLHPVQAAFLEGADPFHRLVAESNTDVRETPVIMILEALIDVQNE